MFCPKCGAQSDTARFCRLCGTNLTIVSNAMSGSEPSAGSPARKGGTTLGVFHEGYVSNQYQELDGHSAITAFGNVTLDLTAAPLQPGDTQISVFSIFGSIDALVPNEVGVCITGLSLFADVKIRGQKITSGLFTANDYFTPGYDQAARRLRIDAAVIFSNLKVRR